MTKIPTTRILAVSQDAKTTKGEKQGYLTGVNFMAQGDTSGYEVCAGRTPSCFSECLGGKGRAEFTPSIPASRIAKTRWFFEDRTAFMTMLVRDIRALVRKADRLDLTPCVRLNGTSSINWNRSLGDGRINVFDLFPDIQLYDYSEQIKQMRKYMRGEQPDNYHLTFSRKENNWHDCVEVLECGSNVAAVFGILKGEAMPDSYRGYQVIDGDDSDLRFLDPQQGLIVGLRPKGSNQKLERDRMLLNGMAIPV